MNNYIEKSKKNYADAIKEAQEFLYNHSDDSDLKFFIENLKLIEYPHSYRWSIIYDYFWDSDIYHDYIKNTQIVTGLTYITEIAYLENRNWLNYNNNNSILRKETF